MYKKLKDLKKHHQLIYSLIIAVGLIGIWRGVWRLFDIFLLPNMPVTTSLVSLGIGIGILAITHHRLS